MSDSLTTLCARGPWTTTDGPLTGDAVAALYRAVPAGRAAMCAALGVSSFTDRRADRALQLLRMAGLIVYSKGWMHV